MLKNFMHPGSSQTDSKQPGTSRTDTKPSATASRTDSNRFNHSSYESPKPLETAKVETVAVATPPTPAEDGNKLIVGPNIKLKGSEITDCEILVVEGRVEASMNSRDIRIAEGGVFSGKAEIDVAEVRGHFEGELTARKRLVIYATGKVSGVIRYGALMVEEGGSITGDVATLSAASNAGKVAEIATQSAAAAEPEEGETSSLELAHSSSTPARNAMGKR
jgi:cytoskeletal protein CcmA (bactofilin family)